MKNAKLTLVGAGPGDPDLISLKGIKALRIADVILYDALVSKELLDYSRPDCQKVFVGKRAGKHSFTQDKINELIVQMAFSYGHVVRLKGGDPFIFGRGKEEMDYAESFDIPTSVVPGISSITLPGIFGIPLTRRGVNESFWVVTATTRSGKLSDDVRLVCQSSATAVFLMGLGKTDQIEAVYRDAGRADLPAVIISKGSLPEESACFGKAGSLSKLKELYQPPAPAIILIGESVGQHPEFYELLTQVNHATI